MAHVPAPISFLVGQLVFRKVPQSEEHVCHLRDLVQQSSLERKKAL